MRDAGLPLPTRILPATSDVLVHNILPFTALALIIGAALWYWAQTPNGRRTIDRAKFNLPIFGPLIRMYAVTKFARTLGILSSSGTQILYALYLPLFNLGNAMRQGLLGH